MIFKLKMSRLLMPILVSLFFAVFMYSQEKETSQVSYKQQTYDLFPKTLDKPPAVPSPFTADDGIEVVIGITRNKEYVLLPVTVENGEPYVYGRSGKGKQLEVDARDFPTLASTGLHSELELDITKTITRVAISEITYKGRPNRSSGAGFMSEDEDIISVLKGDNRLVKKMGLTHPQIARPFFHLWNSILEMIDEHHKKSNPWGYVEAILYNGKKIFFTVESTNGWQESIFNDEIYGGYHIYIRRKLEEKEKLFIKKKYAHLSPQQSEELIKKLSFIHTGEMEPYYIMRYGFYEGHTNYRTDPITIAFIFGLRSIEEINSAFGDLYTALTNQFTRESITRGE